MNGMRVVRAGLVALGMGLAATAPAAVVVDPVRAAIAPGIDANLSPFATAPAVYGAAAVQSMRAVADGSNRLFVNDTRGVISVTTTAGAAPGVWFDIRRQNVGFAQLNGQTGLVSSAFHPNFNVDPAKPGYRTFYTIDTTEAVGVPSATFAGKGPVSHHDVVREWTVADPAAPTATITATRELMRLAQPSGDHGPGTIAFNTSAAPGSSDYGKLYIGLGDGGGINDPYDNAQDLTSPFGKILRIDPADPDGAGPLAYSIPRDNPYAGSRAGERAGEAGALGEIWASGLRNPQQFSWDALTGRMYIADIGQAQLEEVNLGVAGANYGWPLREGTFAKPADKSVQVVTDDPNPGRFTDPIAQYDHGEGSAIGAAQAYRGVLIPELVGQLVVDDIANGRLFHFTPGDTSGEGGLALLRELRLNLNGVPTDMMTLEGTWRVDLRLGVDAAGELYLLTKKDGDIYRLSGAVPEPASWAMMVVGLGLAAALLRRGAGRPATLQARREDVTPSI